MDGLDCSRCGNPRDRDDNFCRRCGHQLTVDVPAVRAQSITVRPRSLPSPLVRSVAVLAIGTGLEWVARRALNSVARAAGRALTGSSAAQPTARVTARPDPTPSTSTIDEVLYIRKVELRR